MSRHRSQKSSKFVAYLAAILLHVLILGAMFLNFANKPKDVEAFDADKIDTIVASAVSEASVQKQLEQIEAQDRQREQERQRRLDELERLRVAEQEQQQELKEQEQELKELEQKKEREREAAEQAEAERKAIALKRKQEQEKAERERKEREAREQRERERLAKLKRQREEEERKRREAQELFEQQLAEEARREAERKARERTTTAIQQALAEITAKIRRLRTSSSQFDPWRVSETDVRVDGNGNVITVKTIKSSGDPRYDLDAEAAIRKASPLPLPDQTRYPDAYRKFVSESFELVIEN